MELLLEINNILLLMIVVIKQKNSDSIEIK